MALDPSDATGNRLYLGTTGGGVWVAQNAAASNAASVVFTPLTDSLGTLINATDASISIGAISVQPGATGVILAGTGDPNDGLDSYYGAGILRSTDAGKTWTLIAQTVDSEQQLSSVDVMFAGEGFAGFAWSTVNPQLVVAAVSQAYEGALVNAPIASNSYQGLYYSSDSGATWHLARITDLNGRDVQGPADSLTLPDGNAATAVVWNPVRRLFIAAVRYHGYYQSVDGVTWTQLAAQPGAGLTPRACPTNSLSLGSVACPIFRGALAVNPINGDTFAWTVDGNNQDLGIWQDTCAISAGSCTNQNISFSQQWSTSPLDEDTPLGPATVQSGDYNLVLSAVPAAQDTLLFAGDNDLWKCSLAAGCTWRNTTNASTCMSAQVAPYQHALAWSSTNPQEIFVGNDSGLWRSLDGVGQTGTVCSSTDTTHFQNLNGALGSLAEGESIAQAASNPNTVMVGLGVNGTAGVKGSAQPPANWPEILGGEGGPVAIDPTNSANWYVNNSWGVSIYACRQATACTQSSFGEAPVISNSQVSNDGDAMDRPAPFLVDPVDPSQLLVGTCRVWRGPSSGSGWSAGNALSPILNGSLDSSCNGAPLIRSMAAMATPGGGEVIYVGIAGAGDGGATLAGHVFGAAISANGTLSGGWHDLSMNPVTNSQGTPNAPGFGVSSIVIDSHDSSGKTVYFTVAGFAASSLLSAPLYRSTDGGAHWVELLANLHPAPANSVAIDPQDGNTVYLAMDTGVFSTRQIASCPSAPSNCWTAYGTGMPMAPVVELVATPQGSTSQVLTAATYGRGLWQIPLWTAATKLTTASAAPNSLAFANQVVGTASAQQVVYVTNTGSYALMPGIVAISGDFSEADNCHNATIQPGAKCTALVSFKPSAAGTRTGQLTISANVAGGQMAVSLSGTAVSSGAVSLTPGALSFDPVQVGTISSSQSATISNVGGSPVSISSVKVSGPFQIVSNPCGSSLAANASCLISLAFKPTQAGAASGVLTVIDGSGTQTAQLTGTGQTAPTDTLSTTSLSFPPTVKGQISQPIALTLSNAGDLPLTSIGTSVSGDFQVSENCGTALPGHSSCVLNVTFLPARIGGESGTLIVSDALRQQTASLSGTGVTPPLLSVSPSKLTFAAQEVGYSSQPMTVTVTNAGGAPMANVSFQIAGLATASFSVGTTTCGAILSSGANCTMQVIFTPASVGGNSANLVITSATIGVAAVTVPLIGTGLAPPAIAVQPPNMAFNNVVVGKSSGAQKATVSNPGGVGLTDLQFAIAGDFAVSPGTCTPALAAGAKCYPTVTFSPTAPGVRSGVLTVSSTSGAAPPVTISLSGTGIAPASIETNPGTLDFGSSTIGQVSTAKTLRVTDQGTAALAGLNLDVTGPFRVQQNQCGASLGANQTCSVQVVFAPTGAGTQTGTITISSTTPGVSTVVVALSGTGIAAAVIQASPTQLTFGSVRVGGTSAALNLSIVNTGGADLAGLSLTVSGDFAVVNNGCSTSLAIGTGCAMQAIFTPSASGNRSGTLTLSSTSAGVIPMAIPLTGIGLSPGSLAVIPSNLNFPGVSVGLNSAPQLATILNTGQLTAEGLQILVSGDYGASQSTCGSTLGAGAECTLLVTFSPSAPGSRTGTLSASSSTAGVGPSSMVLIGAGIPPGYLSVTPTLVSFPATPQGSVSNPITVKLTNPGIATVSGLQAQTNGDFSASLCGGSLLAGATCQVSITFAPTATGIRSGLLTISSAMAGVPPVSVSLTGTGSAPPALVLTPPSLTFAPLATGQISAAQTIAVSNSGAAALNTPTFTVTGDFGVVGNTCTSALAAGGSCAVQINFAPAEAGGRTGTLTASSTTPGVSAVNAGLSGTGLQPASLNLAPLNLSFPIVIVGQSSDPQAVTLTNLGGAPARSLNIQTTPQFNIVQNTCPASLAAGASCTVGIGFAPIAAGAVTGGLTVSSPDAPSSASVAMSGTGGLPATLQIQPGVLNFAATGVGATSSPIPITVSNLGSITALQGLSFVATPGFQLAQNTCSSTLPPQSSCTVSVAFSPVSAGVQAGTLTATSTTLPGGQFVALAGMGFDFTVAPNGATKVTVASGQAASYKLVITPLNGSQGVFTFQCGALPPNALCVVNPATEAVSAGATGFAIVQISTGQSLSSTAAPSNTIARAKRSFLPAACGLLLIPLLWKRRRVFLLLPLLVILAGGVSSCAGAGGGSGGQGYGGGPGYTPPGSYSIPVAVTSNGVAHTVTVSLTVD